MQNTKMRGFTLVEMIVAVGLFSIVMLVSVGALLSLVGANRKAQSLQSVMNNLNVALDGMVRSVRMGTEYHCGTSSNYSDPVDCTTGVTGIVGNPGISALFAFEPYHDCSAAGTDCDANGNIPPWLYWFQTDTVDGKQVGRLYKSETGTIAGGLPITSSDVSIDSVSFYVIGTDRGDGEQPKALMVIQGSAGAKGKTRSTFHVQATAVQRVLDI